MELVLTPMDNHTSDEVKRFNWGFVEINHPDSIGSLSGFDVYYIGRTQRGWFFACDNGECSDIRDGDIINLWDQPYECQIENPL